MNSFSSRHFKSIFFITRIAMLSAIAAILMIFETPLPIFPNFYKIDASSIPVIIGTFAMGPIAGVCIQLLKDLINFITNSSSGGIGQLADFLVCISYIIPAGLIYGKFKTKTYSIIAMVTGTILASITGCLLNYYVLLPFYSKLFSLDVVAIAKAVLPSITDLKTLVIYSTLPFNLFKFTLVSVIAFFVYKKFIKYLSLKR